MIKEGRCHIYLSKSLLPLSQTDFFFSCIISPLADCNMTKFLSVGWTVKTKLAQTVESACNSGDLGLIPRPGRSPGKRNGYPFQYSYPSVHGILQARILDLVATPSSRGSSQPRDCMSFMFLALAARFYTTSTTWDTPVGDHFSLKTCETCLQGSLTKQKTEVMGWQGVNMRTRERSHY